MGQIILIGGSARSGRTKRIDALWREHGEKALLLTPTTRLARTRQSAFVREHGLPGLFGKHAWELTEFARAIVEGTGRQVRMVSMLERRLMVHQALEDLPRNAGVAQLPITPGLVRHLLRVITELKQAAIEPETFRKALKKSKRPGAFDGLVAIVYERYQEALVSEARYDVPGLYWEAERCCNEEAPPFPNNATTLLLDGFDDFTLSQQRFLAALSERVEQLVIGLHYDADPDRSDLFQLQQQWIEKFSAGKSVEKRTFSTDAPQDYIQHIAHHLFWRNPPPSPEGLVANAHLLPCADAQHEIETIGRRIKQLLVRENVAPQRIAVCLADIEQTAGAVRGIFEGFSIPLSMGVSPTLLSTATGAFIMRIFEALDTWERNTVTTLLASPLFKTTDEEVPLVMAFPLMSRKLGVIMGRTEFRDRLRITDSSDSNSFDEDVMRSLSLKYKRFCLLEKLADTLSEAVSIHDYAVLLDKMIDAFGMEAAAAALADTDMAQRETAAVRTVRRLLEQLACTTHLDTPMKRNEFARFLEEALGETRVAVQSAQGPGVCCCSLDGLRHEAFDYVFLGGLNEGVLPRAAPINAVYSESDLHRLRQLKLELPGRYEHTYRQRLLFCHAINAAQQTLTLSWRNQDRSGRDTLPSPFVVDIMDMFETHKINITQPDPGPECFLPEPFLAASPRDLANVAYYRDYKQLYEPIFEMTAPIDRVVGIETGRNSTKPFDIYDGCITSPDLLADLAATYGATAQFSVNQLESYIQFPFRFFMERVLKVQETQQPDAEMDAMTRGSIAHEILYRFHKRFAGTSVAELLAQDAGGTRAAMSDCVETVFREKERALLSVPEVVCRVERLRLEQALQRYLDRAATDFESELPPQHFEAIFGRASRDAEGDLYVEAPFLLSLGEETIRLTGKIDRIDTDGETARIIDYKSSGTPASKQIKSGASLQLTVYAWAVEQHLLPGTSCGEAWYYPVYKNKKQDALLRKRKEDSVQREENARSRITATVHGIRSGQFPPLPDDSLDISRQPVHTAARYEEWRIERKRPEYHASEEEEA